MVWPGSILQDWSSLNSTTESNRGDTMKKLFLILLMSLVSSAARAACTGTSPTWTSTVDRTSVLACIAAASPGDTINVVAGTASWSGGVSISGITLKGAGSSTSGTVITAGTVAMTKHSTQVTRLSGFRFTGSDTHGSVGGSTSARAFRIDNNYFFSSGQQYFGFDANGGVIDHNEFFMNPSQNPPPTVMSIHPNEDWSQAVTFGNTDTQGPNGGERNIYFEDNIFNNITGAAPDGDQGARLVIRHNTYNDSAIVLHGGGPPNDTSTNPPGTRQYEIYNNDFNRIICDNNLNWWLWSRGGSGVFANNTMDNVNTQCFGGKPQIRLGVGCGGAPPYPIVYQQGQTTAPSTQNPPTKPVLIFGNTGAGSGSISVTENGSGGGGGTNCSNPTFYVQQNRDYFLSNQWSWVPFTYPHPLVTGEPTPPPPLPTGSTGIAASFPNDVSIATDPRVILADGFETYNVRGDLITNNSNCGGSPCWSNFYQNDANVAIETNLANVFRGTKSLRLRVPASTPAPGIANALERVLNPTLTTVFMRAYNKFPSNFTATGSEHNGVSIRGNYCGPGSTPACDGSTDKSYNGMENSCDNGGAQPCDTNLYTYYPGRRNCDDSQVVNGVVIPGTINCYGDHFYPDGTVLPFNSVPGDFGSFFVSRPQFVPTLNQWYSYEIMVQLNTIGQRNGRVAMWVDGNLIADFQNLRLRDLATTKLDTAQLEHYIQNNPAGDMFRWYDNVVIATSYIGPISSPAATFNITGAIQGGPISGVTLSRTGTSSGSTTSDAAGAYGFTGLSAGSYTITPLKTGYAFSPLSATVNLVSSDQAGVNFTIQPLPPSGLSAIVH